MATCIVICSDCARGVRQDYSDPRFAAALELGVRGNNFCRQLRWSFVVIIHESRPGNFDAPLCLPLVYFDDLQGGHVINRVRAKIPKVADGIYVFAKIARQDLLGIGLGQQLFDLLRKVAALVPALQSERPEDICATYTRMLPG